MTDAIRTARYEGQQARRLLADLTYLEQLDSRDPHRGAQDWDALVSVPGCRVITAAITGRLVGFVLCLSGDQGRGPGVATGGLRLTDEQLHAAEYGLRVPALVVAPVARHGDVVQRLLDEARLDQPDGRIVLVLPGRHPAVSVARAAGWHEAVRGGSGVQLLLGPDHPALSTLLLHA